MVIDFEPWFMDRAFPEPNSGCWLWEGSMSAQGYAQVGIGGGKARITHLVHRLAHEHFKGPIPKGQHIDHLCMNRICVNPDHLEAVTQAENNRRQKASLIFCENGLHRWSDGDFYINKQGWRRCAPCARETNRRSLERRNG